MEINQLREFSLLAKVSNFTRTARMLNMSQSALSTHITKLEKEIGTKLIDRSNQVITFTPAGRDLLGCAHEMLSAYDAFLSRVQASKESVTGHFAVSLIPHIDSAALALLKRVQDFRKQNPGVIVDIRESIEYNTVDSIRKGAMDCGYYGIYCQEPEAKDGVEVVPLSSEEFVLWVDARSPLAAAASVRPADLEGMTVPIWTGIPNDLERIYHEFFQQFGVTVQHAERYCTSREDFFLNHVRDEDIVLLTRGAENINAIRVRDDRVFVHFTPAVLGSSYVAFKEDSDNEALAAFRDFIVQESEKG